MGSHILLAIHLEVGFGIGALSIAFPTGEGENLVVDGRELDVGAFFVVVGSFDDVAFRLELHEVRVGTTLELEIEGIDVVLGVVGNEGCVFTDCEGVRIFGGDGVALGICPLLEVIAEVLGGRNGDAGSFIKFTAHRVARQTTCPFYIRFQAQGVAWHAFYGSDNIAHDKDFSKSIFLVACELIDLDFQYESVASHGDA